MATRGVFQLTKLYVHYCEHGGSSAMLRNYMKTGGLSKWAVEHPHVEILVKPRNNHHPFLQADYKTGPAGNIHQVCVKNAPNFQEIEKVCDMLHNRSGRKMTKITKQVLTDTPSIQGVWTPFLDLNSGPEMKVTMHQT
jgi:large subunit ribosomal protein L43